MDDKKKKRDPSLAAHLGVGGLAGGALGAKVGLETSVSADKVNKIDHYLKNIETTKKIQEIHERFKNQALSDGNIASVNNRPADVERARDLYDHYNTESIRTAQKIDYYKLKAAELDREVAEDQLKGLQTGALAGVAGGAAVGLGAYAAKKLIQKARDKKTDMSQQDFSRPSKCDFKLTDKMIQKFDKGKTFSNQGYLFFPQNKTRKFIYDVNKEVELWDTLKKSDDPKLKQRVENLEKSLRNPGEDLYLNYLRTSSNGYYDRPDDVKERNQIIKDAKATEDFSSYDKEEFGTGKQIASRILPVYAGSRVQDAKNSYRDLVQYTASLPEDERKKVFKKFEEATTNHGILEGVGLAPLFVMPNIKGLAASVAVGTANDMLAPKQYRKILETSKSQREK